MIDFTFYPVRTDDLPLLYTWFMEPHIIEWWQVPRNEEEFFAYFIKRIRSKDTFPFMVYTDKKPIGYIQYYIINTQKDRWLPTLPQHTVGIDQCIGEFDYLGKGYGQQFIKAFIKYLKEHNPHLQAIIVDPDPTNMRAIKCYEKAGFIYIGEFERPGSPAYLMKYEFS